MSITIRYTLNCDVCKAQIGEPTEATYVSGATLPHPSYRRATISPSMWGSEQYDLCHECAEPLCAKFGEIIAQRRTVHE